MSALLLETNNKNTREIADCYAFGESLRLIEENDKN
jgi:hypothetical protein